MALARCYMNALLESHRPLFAKELLNNKTSAFGQRALVTLLLCISVENGGLARLSTKKFSSAVVAPRDFRSMCVSEAGLSEFARF